MQADGIINAPSGGFRLGGYELGDVAGMVEHIEPLLEANSLVSVHTLESRVAWASVRDDPAFQAMLDRHR